MSATRTSITDVAAYTELCARAAIDDEALRTFRRQPAYVATLEHVTVPHARAYLDAVLTRTPELLADRNRVMRNDFCGGPILADIPGFGPVAPTTLRYLKVLSDLMVRFGSLDGLRIAEIGVGYGGQARLILDRFAVASYLLVDLRPCLDLAHRYLERLGAGPFETRTMEELPLASYDLVISNYAFTECARSIQDEYAARVLGVARAGYLTCNFVSASANLESYAREELLALHAGAAFEAEVPLTHPDNVILTWGPRP